jgi:beta-glucosidase
MNIENKLAAMTIDEKVGQLVQLAPFFYVKDIQQQIFGHVRDLGISEERIYRTGSVLGIGSAKEMIEVQKTYLEQSTAKIPLLFMADIIHGYETIFPVPLALASSFNPDLAFKVARISAIEASTAGIHVTFSPMADIARDPRWGRVVESFGEDPYLNYVFAYNMTEGYQNDGIEKDGNLVSCVKHVAAYGKSEAGRDYNTVDLSRLSLLNDHLDGYKGSIDAGARMAMTSFNTVDYVPATVNKDLLDGVLRGILGFDGVTISDYDSLNQVIAHGVAQDSKEAAKLGLEAGLDIEMASTCYIKHVKSLIEQGKLDMKRLDEAVLRVLKLKDQVGLFENPYKGANEELEKACVGSKAHMDQALTVALECPVLLKNRQGVLPIKGKRIALIGSHAKTKDTNGPWSWRGKAAINTALDRALKQEGMDVVSAEDRWEERSDLANCDVIVLAIGEHSDESGEAHSKAGIGLKHEDVLWYQYAKSFEKPLVVIIYAGRPLVIEEILAADAIMWAWFLGSKGNEALAKLIKGEVSPSGKLPMSMPRHQGQIPIYYNHLKTGRPKKGANDQNPFVSFYLDVENEPRFPFGFGLSYASFTYENLTLSKRLMDPSDRLVISVDVRNESPVAGMETVQLYLQDEYARIARPVKQLKRFQKIRFAGHETKTITFSITLADLTYRDASGRSIYDTGTFRVMVGSNARDCLVETFELEEGRNT